MNAIHFTGGNFPNNPNISIIEKIMSAGRALIKGYDENNYLEKIGLVCTVRPYVQVPHQDFDRSGEQRGVIIHCPLCEEGIWLYVWKENQNKLPKEYQLLHIPFGSMLILDVDVWHGGIMGSPGNVRFHATIFPKYDSTTHAQLVYRKSGNKQQYKKSR